MYTNIQKVLDFIFDSKITKITGFIENTEAKEYLGCCFEAGGYKFIFRKAKITPKKIGQFVTLWKRNANNITEPLHADDDFDFCIIACEEYPHDGIFFFEKSELIKRNIVSTNYKDGKRGFRVYPTWTMPQNQQAKRTQDWQQQCFYDFANSDDFIGLMSKTN